MLVKIMDNLGTIKLNINKTENMQIVKIKAGYIIAWVVLWLGACAPWFWCKNQRATDLFEVFTRPATPFEFTVKN